MYLIEWGLWKNSVALKTDQKTGRIKKPTRSRDRSTLYEDELNSALNFKCASDTPASRGPVFEFNETYLELRSGGAEEKRGLIALAVLAGLAPLAYFWLNAIIDLIEFNITRAEMISPVSVLLDLYMILVGVGLIYLYKKYGLIFTRLEIFTSRHLLIRFNRKTQHVYLHRPSFCGGVVKLPWKATASSALSPQDDPASMGMRLCLMWHPIHTGLPHMEIAFIGKQGQGGSELRDEWEFIRRYMEEGPDSVPRPRLSTRFPSPVQAFSAQFEGLGRFFRKSSWLFKVALLLIWPAFVIVGTGHWLSLMLCWRPRWPKIIREAGLPGKPVPAFTTLSDYPPDIQKRLLANADRWHLKPGKRPERKPRKSRASGAD